MKANADNLERCKGSRHRVDEAQLPTVDEVRKKAFKDDCVPEAVSFRPQLYRPSAKTVITAVSSGQTASQLPPHYADSVPKPHSIVELSPPKSGSCSFICLKSTVVT